MQAARKFVHRGHAGSGLYGSGDAGRLRRYLPGIWKGMLRLLRAVRIGKFNDSGRQPGGDGAPAGGGRSSLPVVQCLGPAQPPGQRRKVLTWTSVIRVKRTQPSKSTTWREWKA